jgi:hypothetical protein
MRIVPAWVLRVTVAMAVTCALLVAAPSASAVKSGRWKGGDIEFGISKNRIKKVSVVAYHTCQKIGTGEYYNEIQRFTPPGRFKIKRNGRFSGAKYVNRADDYFDIRFSWVGRFRRGRMRAVIQTMYKYYSYDATMGTVLTSCYSQKVFKAKPRS